MSFDYEKRLRIREEADFHCMICGKIHPEGVGLDAHSLNRTHTDEGMAVCSTRYPNSCHQKLHDLAQNPEELERLSREAAALSGLSYAYRLIDLGVREEKIIKKVSRRPF